MPGKRGERAGAVGVAVQAQLAARLEHPPAHREALAAVAVVAQKPDTDSVAERLHAGDGGVLAGVVDDQDLVLAAVLVEPLAEAGDGGRDARLLVEGGNHDRYPGRRHGAQSRTGPRARAPGGRVRSPLQCPSPCVASARAHSSCARRAEPRR